MLNTMRWTDNAMGSDFDWGWSDINQAFAAGQVGMFISGSDVYTNMVQAYNINPSHLRPGADPAGEQQERRRPRWRHARRGQPEGEPGPGCGGHEVDQLLLHAEAREPAGRRSVTPGR